MPRFGNPTPSKSSNPVPPHSGRRHVGEFGFGNQQVETHSVRANQTVLASGWLGFANIHFAVVDVYGGSAATGGQRHL
ncbi:hypothetical protein AVEN_174555-1 [Araneus ventricosus]|uniref:Uncharacterized protein n=1 Tax=Araneus ventricosus TaxID=182803 RepID=A0A4Y2KCA2_ARAVE|nr:hypothetical protein AVEN_174555-1 [Araneus ventricosus]